MSEAPNAGGDHFDRFANAGAAREQATKQAERQRERQEEQLELYGDARELFLNRALDTFSVERHGTEIEFYRPVGATDVDLSDLEDRDLAQRLQRGSDVLEKVEERQVETIRGLQDDDVDLNELFEEALDGTELMRKALSAHAVDESFHDPRVWTTIFRDDDTVSEVFEDFLAEGEPEAKRQKRDALQSLMSDGNSGN
jgi:hypothetical protein